MVMHIVTSFQKPRPRSPRPPRIPLCSSKLLLGERLARRYGTRATHIGASVTCQKSPHAQWWSRANTSKSLGTNTIKSCAGKRYWPHLWVHRLSRGGPGGHCRYPVDRVPLCTRFKRSAPWLQTRSWCQMALAPPRVPGNRARYLLEQGFGVATCPMAQSAPPARKGFWCRHVAEAPCTPPVRRRLRSRHVPRGSRPTLCSGRLCRHHMTEALGSPSDRALVLPRVLWLQTRLLVREGSGAATYPCVPKTSDIRPIMDSPGTRCR
jgi:hypothetical protein